jgi:hypothetical protein
MSEVKIAPIMVYFSKLEDPQSTINRLHPLETQETLRDDVAGMPHQERQRTGEYGVYQKNRLNDCPFRQRIKEQHYQQG